jgi:hypothetical protein
MSPHVIARGLVLGSVVGGLFAVIQSPASGAAAPLPRGCNVGYAGQTIAASGGRATTFSFQGLNAVPPSHTVKDARISWGDGKTTAVTAKRRAGAFLKGCYVTNFTGRHIYPVAAKCGQPLCTKSYHVTIHYRDAQTNARLTLSQLHVIIGRVAPK